MSSFFTIPSAAKKRKRPEGSEAPKKRFAPTKSKNTPREAKPSRTPRKPQRDESISGSDNEDDSNRGDDEQEGGLSDVASTSGSEEGDDAEETAAERRLRLAERYLENIREEVDEVGFDAEEIDRDLIAERLKEDAAESKGRMYRKLAQELSFDDASHTVFRNDSGAITSVATCPPFAYTVSKDMFLVKWQIQELPSNQFLQKKKKSKRPVPPPRRKPTQLAFVRGDRKKSKDNTYQGHVSDILTVAASQDGKYVVTGGRDRRIIIWDASNLTPLRVFTQHRDAVTGLAFRRGTNQLYSSSKDRTIKVWSLDELAYIETLFGHQDEVVDIAALAQERCISVGARDRTARLWKVVEETQLVFRGGGGEKKSRSGPRVLEGSMDRVAMIDEETFVTGGDNGCISLWVIHKKKPIFTLPQAHGMDPALQPDEASAEVNPEPEIVPAPQPRWITALATIPYSDVVLSGSWDGQLRAWRLSDDKKKLEPLGGVGSGSLSQLNGHQLLNGDMDDTPVVKGVINDISVFERGDRGKDGACIVVAVGKELRMGRWKRLKEGAKNGAVIFEIPRIPKTNGVVAEEEEE
jgi:ribosomal RNA-processing protein 9